ncbi:Bilirubin oxidase [Kitasatospora sp. MMS16-BH015]|uniref:multicopper oxidase family protein n=1 Tax=Kitasatospora sp. MMS16-BH015 TaxID=2018025 RepID=UPI000CA39E80|nr:multicopper oxidase domain-containing protein [Kitasatospora sp. MMS16-BH015]AUG78391.1 Bilirubin oxidase [Kitasatospora sp. MMS16-BH015]
MLNRKLSRRGALKAGAVTTGLIGGVGLAAPLLGPTAEADVTGVVGPAVTPMFAVPLTVPQVLQPTSTSSTTDYYSVTMQKAVKEIIPGLQTEVETYNGQYPGPTIKARSGRRVVINQTNALDLPTSVHLHGAEVPVDSDGNPMVTIPPGGSKTYTYPNNQLGAPLWFHDHAHHLESEHVYRGLSGMYQLSDDNDRCQPLPSGQYDVPLLLRDVNIDSTGKLVYTMGDFTNRTTILVNGRPWPYFQVAARQYRFRILNSSNLRFFVLALSDGGSFTQIGSDGGLLATPCTTNQLKLSPGERADIVIDFSRYPVGTQLVLLNNTGPGPADLIGKVMRFDVVRDALDLSYVPDTLRTLPTPPIATVNRTFVLRMDEDGRANPMAYINDLTYDPNRIDTQITWGTTEVWTITNANVRAPHNFHVHLVQFRILERNGKAPDPSESGLKDTVALLAGETVKIQLTFDSYRGVYLYHCHLFDHGAMGMMGTMQIS